jgi:hypothetical protein
MLSPVSWAFFCWTSIRVSRLSWTERIVEYFDPHNLQNPPGVFMTHTYDDA